MIGFALKLFLVSVFPGISAGAPAPVAPLPAVAPPAPLTVTFLANAGFLLRSGDDAVIIDGFVGSPYSIYGSLSAETRTAMLAGTAPFGNVTAALVSHRHADHFQRSTAMKFMRAHPETVLVSSDDVASLVPELAERVESPVPGPAERLSWEREGVRVTFLNLPHGGERWRDLQNVGHIIEIGGRRVVHVGDAAEAASAFDGAGLRDERFDVALIPYWFFSSKDGRARIAQHLRANVRIACHIPPKDLDEVRAELKRNHPGVRLLDEPLEELVVD